MPTAQAAPGLLSRKVTDEHFEFPKQNVLGFWKVTLT